jgi:hypothetical protein
MKIKLLLSVTAAIFAFCASANAQVDSSVVTSRLGVSSDHLSVKVFGDGLVDIKYQIPGCSLSASAARTGFKNDLVRLLPVLTAKYPWIKNISIAGGCPVLDVYGKSGYDDAFISAMFMRDELNKVVWERVRSDDLFYHVSFGRFE